MQFSFGGALVFLSLYGLTFVVTDPAITSTWKWPAIAFGFGFGVRILADWFIDELVDRLK